MCIMAVKTLATAHMHTRQSICWLPYNIIKVPYACYYFFKLKCFSIWGMSPDFGVSDKGRLKSVSSATVRLARIL